MSANTYFMHPYYGPHAIFLTTDPNERRRLRDRGWQRVTRGEAVKAFGGGPAFHRATRNCQSGFIVADGDDSRCGGHDLSRAPKTVADTR